MSYCVSWVVSGTDNLAEEERTSCFNFCCSVMHVLSAIVCILYLVIGRLCDYDTSWTSPCQVAIYDFSATRRLFRFPFLDGDAPCDVRFTEYIYVHISLFVMLVHPVT